MLPRKLFPSVFSALFALCRVCSTLEIDLTVDIEAGKRECFHQTIKKGSQFEIEYQVLVGGDMDIHFMLQGPSGRVLVSQRYQSQAKHVQEASEDGDYAFCLDNTFSRMSNKVVFFELVTDEDEAEEEFKDLAEEENTYDVKLEDFKEFFLNIKDKLERCVQTQNVLRAIEARDRSIQEDNFMRVNFWSTIQVFIMVSVALTHVLIIRSLFADQEKSKHKMSQRT